MKLISDGIERKADISSCKRYRYSLTRIWNSSLPMVMFVGLNPSRANAFKDDRTITRLIGFSKSWGYGGFYITNLFAYRTPYPKQLFKYGFPVDKKDSNKTDIEIEYFAGISSRIVFCWGTKGGFECRDIWALRKFENAYCFRQTKDGHPEHPLYLKKETQPIKFNPYKNKDYELQREGRTEGNVRIHEQ